MQSVPPYPDQGLIVGRPHPQAAPTPERTPAHRDRGLIHALPVVAFSLGGVAYPLYVLVGGTADSPVGAALLAFVAGVLIAGFVTMLGYTVVRLGTTRRALARQLIGLGVTLLGALCGLALAFVVAAM